MFRALLFLNASNEIDIPFMLNWNSQLLVNSPSPNRMMLRLMILYAILSLPVFWRLKERKDRVIETPMIQINLE